MDSWLAFYFSITTNVVDFLISSVYGQGKNDSNSEWDSTFGDISLDGGMKSESYDTMYDDDENYSENSNLD